MKDNRDRFKEKINVLEDFAASRPVLYKSLLLLFTLLGYAYIGLVLIILAVLIFMAVYMGVEDHFAGAIFKIAAILVGLTYVVARSLWVKIDPPEGIKVDRKAAPELFKLIDDVGKKLRCPEIHEVLIDDKFNAYAVQVPRLGILGFKKSYLVLGLPLMMADSLEEYKSIVAHELGHISNSHGAFGSWIYRMMRTWSNIKESIEKNDNKGAFLFRWFFNWYVPRYDVYSYIYRRQNEYEADRCSVEIAGAKTAAAQLVNFNVKYSYLEEVFWKSIYDRVNNDEMPPENVFEIMHDAFKENIDENEFKIQLNAALARKPDIFDTHPTLMQRIEAMGTGIPGFEYRPGTAADELLGDNVLKYAGILSRIWAEGIKELWRERYDEVYKAKEKLSELGTKKDTSPLDMDEEWELCCSVEMVEGDENALPLYMNFLKQYPDVPYGNFAAGRILIEKRDSEGIGFIERAMELDAEYIMEGCKLIHNFWVDLGAYEEARKYYNKAARRAEFLSAAEKERNSLPFKKVYIPHGLTEEKLDILRKQLANYSDISVAYLVQKKLELTGDKPLYVLGITFSFNVFTSKDTYADYVKKLADEVTFAGETFVVYLEKDNAPLKRIMRDVPHSKIYDKKQIGN